MYMLTRKHLCKLISKSEQTEDGFFWSPEIRHLLMLKGNCSDEEYFYPREMFMCKVYFEFRDIDLFLAKENYKISSTQYYNKSERFLETNQDIENLSVYDKVPGNDFTVSELIDMWEFRNN